MTAPRDAAQVKTTKPAAPATGSDLPSARAGSAAPSPGARLNGDSLAAWLDLVTSLLRLPAGQAAEIREELESHLRDRVRDLMLGGLDAEEAMTRAISELGDAADLAARFRSARRDSPRRRAMNTIGLGVAAGAAVISMAALLRPGAQPVPTPATIQTAAESSGTGEGAGQPYRVEMRYRVKPTTLDDAVARIAELESQLRAMRAEVLSEAIPARSAQADPLELKEIRLEEIDGLSLADALAVVASKVRLKLEILGDVDTAGKVDIVRNSMFSNVRDTLPCARLFGVVFGSLTYRIRGETMQVASQEFFVNRDYSLRAYAVGGLVATSSARQSPQGPIGGGQSLINTLQQLSPLPEPGERLINPGRVGTYALVGPTLFVDGPEIVHERVRWILRQAAAGGWSPEQSTTVLIPQAGAATPANASGEASKAAEPPAP